MPGPLSFVVRVVLLLVGVLSLGSGAAIAQTMPSEPAPEPEPTFDEEPPSGAPAPSIPPPPPPPPETSPAAAPTQQPDAPPSPSPPSEPAPDPPTTTPPIAAPSVPATPPAPTEPEPEAPRSDPAPEPPEVPVNPPIAWPPDSDQAADWILLTTGEWLKGTLHRMREGVVDFTSASVGNQSLAWTSISELVSPNRLVFVRRDRSTMTGPSRLRGGTLVVATEAGARSMPQTEILSIVPAKTTELSRWSLLASLGLAGRFGNAETANYTSFARLSRVDAYNRTALEYTGAYGTALGVDITNRHRGTLAWDLFVSQTFYVTPVSAEAVYDRFQNLALRWTAATGFGARALRLATFTMKTEFASGFLQNNYVSVQAGEPTNTQGAFVRPGVQMNGALAGNLTAELGWQSSIVVTEPAYTFHHGSLRLALALFGSFTADWSVIYDRQETTITDAAGVTPRNDDLTVSLGFGLDLH